MPLVAARRARTGSKFGITIANEIVRRLSKGSRLPKLLGGPGIGRRSGHIHMHNLPRLQLDDEEGKERTEEEIRDLQEITGPHLCHMIAQERFPVLSTGSFWANLLHIPLDGPFTDPNIQLE